MDSTSFTFLNTTGAPGLSPSAAKQMRAHITKTNFSNRRQRLAQASAAKNESTQDVISQKRRELSTVPSPTIRAVENTRIGALSSSRTSTASYYHNRLLPFELLTIQGNGDSSRSKSEAAWFQLHLSEPALIEAYMAVEVRFWSQDMLWQRKAISHSNKAVNHIIQQITSSQVQSDGVLGAVITMAFGERLMHNDLAWNVHMDGLSQMIKQRRSQGIFELPSWLSELFIFDSLNYVYDFPRVYHWKLVDALGDSCNQILYDVAILSNSLIELRKLIDTYHAFGSRSVATEIEDLASGLHYDARALRVHDNPLIQATSRAIELALHLSWPSQSEVNLTLLANELKEALCQLNIRACVYMELTSCQIMIGAIAADKGSPTRTWFMLRLKTAMQEMQLRGWDQPLTILEKAFISDGCLMEQFRGLIKELEMEEN